MSEKVLNKQNENKLYRGIGLTTLTATGVCSMFGASIYIVPFMIQKNIPGIAQWVLPAFIFAALPAILAAFAYAILSSAMPRAGGSYIYASRGLNPYLGFIASFSQWFGLSVVIGVIAYIIVPFIRDVFVGIGWTATAQLLEIGFIRVGIALGLIWLFVGINITGLSAYKKTLLPMMYTMIGLAGIVIISGFIFTSEDFLAGLKVRENRTFVASANLPFDWKIFLSASALMFSSFIGFDSIAQAGGEAKQPSRNLPRAILIAILGVGVFYFLFALSVYRIIPWSFVAAESMVKDITAPGLLAYVLPEWLSVIILLGAVIALINDLPAMLLSVSRLMFAWSKDHVFPEIISSVHSKFRTPYVALLTAGIMASIGVLGSHFAGDFFMGIDIMVTSMMFNFILMCITLIFISKKNKALYNEISIVKNRTLQLVIAVSGLMLLLLFLLMHTYKDLTQEVEAWYFHSTYVWLVVMVVASAIFLFKWWQLKSSGIDVISQFKNLPKE